MPNDTSSQPCGCDAGAHHGCQRHLDEAQRRERDLAANGPSPEPGMIYSLIAGASLPEPETRITDPTTGGQKGSKLARFSLIPPDFLWALAEHYGLGARKYADRNWERGYKWSLSVDALLRHLMAWLNGESNDAETGSSHLIAVAWHACALFVFERRQLGTDDVRRLPIVQKPRVAEDRKLAIDEAHKNYSNDRNWCPVRRPLGSGGPRWYCTRLPGHTGRHVATDGRKLLAEWETT